MILQYFKKKENKYKNQADAIYLKILQESKILMKKNYFNEVNFDSSFELITILLIFYIKTFNSDDQYIKKKINDELMQNFINDLDNSIREIGIGDMAIGKYVKNYVKKFYYRVKIIDNILENENYIKFVDYLNSLKVINNKNTNNIASELFLKFDKIKKNKDIL
jgi:cytochrome b pre-mRNA-processing protein 3